MFALESMVYYIFIPMILGLSCIGWFIFANYLYNHGMKFFSLFVYAGSIFSGLLFLIHIWSI